jgi:hypothetical protein
MIFKEFLLNENKITLSEKIGDILNALEDLLENMKNLGARITSDAAENIVNQIRSNILRAKWPDNQKNNLILIRNCAVAIMKSIKEKNDLEMTIKISIKTLEKIVANLESPIFNQN